MPRGGHRPNSGRKPGAKNKSRRERDLMARYQAEREAAGTERKLAKDTLEDFMQYFIGVAKLYQPFIFREGTGAEENGASDPIKFKEFSRAAIECAISLAPYQSPRLSAVAVASAIPRDDITYEFSLKIGNDEPRLARAIEHEPSL